MNQTAARSVLHAAREAGFRRVQVKFPWTKVGAGYVRALAGWVRSEGLIADALGAYVNCYDPEAAPMDTRGT